MVGTARSARSAMRAITCTVSTGKRPVAVSAESMIASAPSKIAVATSLTSARVGREWVTIDSSIWVATMTGTLASRAWRITSFWMIGHVLERHLDAEVAARHHDRVDQRQDARQVGHDLGPLELGDDRDVGALVVEELAHLLDVGGGAHEGDRHVVDACSMPKRRSSRSFAAMHDTGTRQPRERHPLVVGDHAARDDPAADLAALHRLHRAAGSSRRPSRPDRPAGARRGTRDG